MTTSSKASLTQSIHQAAAALKQGLVLAYPTEAVFGLGCDPDQQAAVEQILRIKRRPVEKGLILLAATLEQLLPYIDYAALSDEQQQLLVSIPERPTTWLVPVSAATPSWISGKFDSVAVRLTQHPLVTELCAEWGKPIVSTSANYSGETPAETAEQAMQLQGVDWVLDGPLGAAKQTSQIKDIFTGEVIRA
ncbi:Sua5/YciO/YrdC/YwlC family protein [Agarivorans aestuarii]|uniref:Threonylcarbamoyl-AMP synthase n=1 Tax=Agarivorans aestuarii TaxID=1563703 RepID=A0ABU7G963_9ALTE|nr:Sua5/YciO/YrdC/YwlC family protein [Agarivorans aestuarii]MEE1675948.1 Sua5/YciO/YrdC/YwlC family protein [Agarivorans aestuarii]